MKATLAADHPHWNKYLIPAIILIVMILAGLFTYNTLKTRPGVSTSPGSAPISASELEEQYGLRVNLIGVTAAGGLVDLRLKIVDAEKAKQLLKDGKNPPELAVADSSVVLTVSEDSQSQEIKLENDGNLFLLFPNARNVVKPGSPVTVRFGDVSLEPIIAK